MKNKFFVISSFLVFITHNSKAQKGYVIYFGGDFKNESIIIQNQDKNYLKKTKITADPSNSISKYFLFFDSTYFGSTVKINVTKTKESVIVPLKSNELLKYVYIWYKRKKLDFQITDDPIPLE